MKNSNDTIGNRTRDLPACSAVPQPTAPPRTPTVLHDIGLMCPCAKENCRPQFQVSPSDVVVSICGEQPNGLTNVIVVLTDQRKTGAWIAQLVQ